MNTSQEAHPKQGQNSSPQGENVYAELTSPVAQPDASHRPESGQGSAEDPQAHIDRARAAIGEVLSGPSPEAVRALEEADIDHRDKVDMLLVSLGLRPATFIRYSEYYPLGGTPTKLSDSQLLDKYTALAQQLGLTVEPDRYDEDMVDQVRKKGKPDQLPMILERIDKGDHPQRARLDIFMGQDEEAMTALKHAWAEEGDPTVIAPKGERLASPIRRLSRMQTGTGVHV